MGLRSLIIGDYLSLFYLMPILGGLFVWTFYEFLVGGFLWTNVGSMMVGSAVGAYIVLTGAYVFGAIILIPHIIDFIMYVYSVTIGRKNFDKIKFGKLRKDGTIESPTRLKLKFLLPYYFKLTEKQTTILLFIFTGIFCVLGLYLGV